MVTRIIFARHRQTKDNVLDIATGTNESPLTTLGRGQAVECAYGLKRFNPDALYTSPLERAKETAQIIGAHIGLMPIVDNRLIERYVGNYFQTLSNARIAVLVADEFARVRTMTLEEQLDYRYSIAPEAQTPRQKVEELMDFVAEVSQRHPDQTVIAVSHGAAIGNLHAVLGHILFRSIFGADSIGNGSYIVVEHDSQMMRTKLVAGPSEI